MGEGGQSANIWFESIFRRFAPVLPQEGLYQCACTMLRVSPHLFPVFFFFFFLPFNFGDCSIFLPTDERKG